LRILDDRKRLFGIVNPIDAIVIVAIIVGAVVVANVLFGVNPATVSTGHGSKTIEMVFMGPTVRKFDPSLISKGDKVTKLGGASVMGNVESVRSEPALLESPLVPKGSKVYKSQLTTDVFITVRGMGDISADGVFMGDEQIRANMDIQLLAPRWTGHGLIVSIKAID
jgi:hypothetical protein